MRAILITASLWLAFALIGCDRSPSSGASDKPASGAAANGNHDHKPGETDEHAPEGGGHTDHHGGPVIELGSVTVDGMTVKASRDQGEIKPGGDAPIDVWIDGGLGNAASVRFWIGTEDAKGSVKARAEVENGKWHTHTEAPDPFPAGSKLWVEIDDREGKKSRASFELKM